MCESEADNSSIFLYSSLFPGSAAYHGRGLEGMSEYSGIDGVIVVYGFKFLEYEV